MIAIEHLTRDYGEGRGIFDLSLEVKQGEVFGYLGWGQTAPAKPPPSGTSWGF